MNSLLGEDRLGILQRLVAEVADVPGDLAEIGVFRGGSAHVIHHAAPHRRLHLFDTFAGLPDPDPDHDVHPAGRFAAPVLEAVGQLVGAPITVHVGRFPDSVAGLTLPPLAFVHVDGDLYWSTRDAIAICWSILSPGGVMVFDDYRLDDTPGVTRALDESGLRFEVIGIQAIVRKDRDP